MYHKLQGSTSLIFLVFEEKKQRGSKERRGGKEVGGEEQADALELSLSSEGLESRLPLKEVSPMPTAGS